MDLIVLNKDLDPIVVVDLYESFIWTDRYFRHGDFELYAPIFAETFSIFKKGYYLQRPGSDRAMIIEDIRTNNDIENGDRVTITGRSLESILYRRVIWGQMLFGGNFQDAIEQMLNACIISPSNSNRKISNLVFKRSTDPRITSLTLDAQYTGDNLYEVIQKLCEERGVGFRVTLNANKQFVFELYVGTDRSYDQTDVPYVIFSPNFDNVISSNYTESDSSLKNVALIGGEGDGSARRYTAVGNLSGLDRREMFVDARDISSEYNVKLSKIRTYQNRVYNRSLDGYSTDLRFDTYIIDVRGHTGRYVNMSMPFYTDPEGMTSNYGAVGLDQNEKPVILLANILPSFREDKETGYLEDISGTVPEGIAYIAAPMFNQYAINTNIYTGSESDFHCEITNLSNAEYIEQLRQRGKEYLSENTDLKAFDGQMETSIMYKFGEDFFEGDIVQAEDEYGHQARARVLEVVVSDNESGFSVYPTFKSVEEEGDETV